MPRKKMTKEDALAILRDRHPRIMVEENADRDQRWKKCSVLVPGMRPGIKVGIAFAETWEEAVQLASESIERAKNAPPPPIFTKESRHVSGRDAEWSGRGPR